MSTPASPAVVIVDDEQAYAALLADALTNLLEAPVLTFTRPDSALQALATQPAGILVTDYFMPEMNGCEFLDRALQLRPATPCIIITGHSDALDEEEDLSRIPELKQVLAKPFAPRALAAAIRKHWPAAAGS